eukprot:CAMPEP_0168694980 /NCGR_PEP_ID=MMETSP0503-20121227/34582_1 /TAXON_ID=89963 /ORGANISM="Heterocapsa rotundata, Strain SCCAP K-0483" /LENGTH=159 /DNA_ID=CAMNT_0008740659 /DNA_START=1 /DNA_END=478 /DNA_ORIENTATION=-
MGSPEPPSADVFGEILQQLDRSHRYTVDLLEQEIKDLKVKLDSVINAQWNLGQDGGEDGWVANPNGDMKKAGALRLALQDPHAIPEPGYGDDMWNVSNDFRVNKKIEEDLKKSSGPSAFDVKPVWMGGKEKAKAKMGQIQAWSAVDLDKSATVKKSENT